jgi:hypothetical protein
MSDGFGWTRRVSKGDRVQAPDKDGVVMEGQVVDELNVMYFIMFDNGTDNFVYKADRNLTKRQDV